LEDSVKEVFDLARARLKAKASPEAALEEAASGVDKLLHLDPLITALKTRHAALTSAMADLQELAKKRHAEIAGAEKRRDAIQTEIDGMLAQARTNAAGILKTAQDEAATLRAEAKAERVKNEATHKMIGKVFAELAKATGA
jgi:uncharacterized protein involved in exopolysaccharide biosynthesis